jgi:hypothetical protein
MRVIVSRNGEIIMSSVTLASSVKFHGYTNSPWISDTVKIFGFRPFVRMVGLEDSFILDVDSLVREQVEKIQK